LNEIDDEVLFYNLDAHGFGVIPLLRADLPVGGGGDKGGGGGGGEVE
jgi:hypothetical protein